MNKDRRKQLAEIQTDIAKAIDLLSGYQSDLESVRDDEQDYYDNMPESFQNGEKGETAQAAISALEEAIEAIETFVDAGVAESVEEAQT